MLKESTLTALLTPLVLVLALSGSPVRADSSLIDKGREVAFDRKKGNCLACHMIADGSLPGNQGPALIAMQARFPDKATLKAQIVNPLERNPNSIMPPFGLHDILNDEEIDAIVEYLYTL